jgi:sulfonate dioxygenase
MAPALVETPSLPERFPTKKAAGGLADYKEAFNSGPAVYKQDAELKGTAKQPPAKYPNYLPTWDLEKK